MAQKPRLQKDGNGRRYDGAAGLLCFPPWCFSWLFAHDNHFTYSLGCIYDVDPPLVTVAIGPSNRLTRSPMLCTATLTGPGSGFPGTAQQNRVWRASAKDPTDRSRSMLHALFRATHAHRHRRMIRHCAIDTAIIPARSQDADPSLGFRHGKCGSVFDSACTN